MRIRGRKSWTEDVRFGNKMQKKEEKEKELLE